MKYSGSIIVGCFSLLLFAHAQESLSPEQPVSDIDLQSIESLVSAYPDFEKEFSASGGEDVSVFFEQSGSAAGLSFDDIDPSGKERIKAYLDNRCIYCIPTEPGIEPQIPTNPGDPTICMDPDTNEIIPCPQSGN